LTEAWFIPNTQTIQLFTNNNINDKISFPHFSETTELFIFVKHKHLK